MLEIFDPMPGRVKTERSKHLFGDRIQIRIYSECSRTEYEYEHIRKVSLTRIRIYSGSTSGPNTNIFVSIKWTEYEYLNIFGLNVRISFDEYSIECCNRYQIGTIILVLLRHPRP